MMVTMVTICEFVLQVFSHMQTAGGGTFIPESETFIPEVDSQSGNLKEVSTCEYYVIYRKSYLLVCKTDKLAHVTKFWREKILAK